MNRVSLTVLATFALILLISGLVAYTFRAPAVSGVTHAPTPAANQAQSDISITRRTLWSGCYRAYAYDCSPVGNQPLRELPCDFRLLRFSRRCWRFDHGAVSRRRGAILTLLRLRF